MYQTPPDSTPMFPDPTHPTFDQDARRRMIIANSIDGVLAPKQAPAPAVVDNRSPRERMLELHPHSALAELLRELEAQKARNG